MKTLEQLGPGDTVCIYGRGTTFSHSHKTVKRVTKTMIVVGWIRDGQEVESRFSRDSGHSLPRSEYGGTTISYKCQGPQ